MIAGIQGPVVVAQAGEKVIIHFKNLASQPYSISPVGITYWKQSEGKELLPPLKYIYFNLLFDVLSNKLSRSLSSILLFLLK